MSETVKIEACARAAHEANRAYCLAIGDTSQVSWEEAPEWQRSAAVKGVEGVLRGNGPREAHATWLEDKRASGWTYGPVKDAEKKQHPCLVAYDELPDAQKAKDGVFVTVVRAMAIALGLLSAQQAVIDAASAGITAFAEEFVKAVNKGRTSAPQGP